MFHSLSTAFCWNVDAGGCCQALLEGAQCRVRVWISVHGTTQKSSSPQAPFRQTPEYCWIDTSGLASNFAVKITVLVFTEWASSHAWRRRSVLCSCRWVQVVCAQDARILRPLCLDPFWLQLWSLRLFSSRPMYRVELHGHGRDLVRR